MDVQLIKSLIETGLPGAGVLIEGDGKHFKAFIISDEFTGKTLLQQHRMVYETLGDKLGNEIHALSMQTYTVKQWENQKPLKTI